MGEYSLADDVLFIGHSLVGVEIPAMLEDVVRAQGGDGTVSFQVINGAPLAWNWENSGTAQGIDARAMLPKGDTEVVVMTEAVPLANHTTWSDTNQYASHFYKLAVEARPDARVYLYETWHSLDSGTGIDVPYDENDGIPWRDRIDSELPRWQAIVEYVNAHRGRGNPEMMLVPAGQAMARLYDEIEGGRVPGLTDIGALFDDDIHPNDLGDYFVTMVQYATIYGRNPRGLPRNLRNAWGENFDAPSAKLAARLQEIAWDAVRGYAGSGIRRGADESGAPGRPAFAVVDTNSVVLVGAQGDAAPNHPPTATSIGPGDIAPTRPEARGLTDPSLGMGLGGIADWSTQHPFVNIMKTARPWIGHLPGQWGGWEPADLEAGGYLDANGWPTAIPKELSGIATIILTEQPEGAHSLAGRYRLSYAGEGTIEISGRASNISRGNGEIWFDYTPGDDGMVIITITATDPRGTGDHIRDVAVVSQENIALFEAGEIFDPRWIAVVADLRLVRFMDWMYVNNSKTSAWEDRPRPADHSYTESGVPVEVMVALANQIGADPWFNIPHMATDAYVRAFAEYIRDHLDPKLKAHVEYSNEIWNWQFEQTHWAQAQAQARWGANAPGDAYMQFAGMRAAQQAQIWDDVFGSAADDRLVKIISTQTGWLGLEAPLLEAPLWAAEDPGRNAAPATYFDAYGVTGYFSGGLGEDSKAPLVKQWIADSRAAAATAATALGLTGPARADYMYAHEFDSAVTRAAAELRDGSVTGDKASTLADLLGKILPYQAAVAKTHDLDLIMYEGGTHVVGIGNWVNDEDLTAFFTHLNYTPEMAGLYETLLVGWKDLGGTVFNAFVDLGGPSKWGSWGALRFLEDDNPRWRALAAFDRQVPAWWEDRAADTFVHGVTLSGGKGDDTLAGTSEEDVLLGYGGDDLMIGHGQSDRLHGGDGQDTALLPGGRADYTFETEGGVTFAIGPRAATRLVSVERIVFADEADPK